MFVRLLALLSWAHLQLVEPIVRWWEEVVLGSWEEWLLALVRQGFEETTRFLNALATWFLSLFSKRSYREQLRRSWQENSWQQWWGEVATRPSTLNALVANLVAQQQGEHSIKGIFPADGAPVPDTGVTVPQLAAGLKHNGPPSQSSAGGAAWWPRSIRQGPGNVERLRQGVSLSSRLERPVVFVQQSGMGILDELAKRRHGLIEDSKMAAQLAVSRCFEVARSAVRAALFLPSRDTLAALANGAAAAGHLRRTILPGRGGHRVNLPRSKSAHMSIAEMAYQPGAGAGSSSASMSRQGLQRSRSYGRLHTAGGAFVHHATEAPSDALSVIRAAGYPHELHTVTTGDGYVLRLERIPRPGARDVVFFMHGVLDTSMAWVSGGVTGSQAFAAWEAGLDVWLGNSRGNAPRQHQDPSRRGWRYWEYNINHMGMYDIAAQLDHIHNVKCGELGAGTVTLDLDRLGPLAERLLGGPAAGAGAGAAAAIGKRMSANAGWNGGSEPQRQHQFFLPGRAVSTVAACVGLEDADSGAAVQGGAPGASRGAIGIRHSNSDGNLYRWGSCNSASSGGRVALGDTTAAAAAALAAGCSSGSGTVIAADGPAAVAAAPLLAPPTPQQLSPQQQYTATATGASTNLVSAASLGHDGSSSEQSPAASCDGSESAAADDALAVVARNGGADGIGKAALPSSLDNREGPERRQGLEPAGTVGCHEAEEADEMEAAARRASVSLPAAASRVTGSSAEQQHQHAHGPPTSLLRRNIVTLTAHPPSTATYDDELVSDSLLAAPSPAAAPPSAATTTFTLEAKTRTDFGPPPPPAAVAADHRRTEPAAGTTARATDSHTGVALPPSQSRDTLAGSAGAGGGAIASGDGAASVLEVVGSVLGPAADAVTHAVSSAGAAIATAAASASHMLLPYPYPSPSPQRLSGGGIAPPPAGSAAAAAVSVAAPAAASQRPAMQLTPTASPFAGIASQASVAAAVSGRVAAVSPQAGATSTATASPSSSSLLLPSEAAAVVANGTHGAAQQNGSPPRGQGFAFRRACSANRLAAAAEGGSGPEICILHSGAAAVGPTRGFSPCFRLAAPEQSSCSSFGLSAASSGRSSAGESDGLGADGPSGPQTWSAAASDPRAAAAALAGTGGCSSGRAAAAGPGSAAAAPAAVAPCPYKLRCVAHSLGGMSMLIHLVNRRREGRPHNVNRLLLLTPAGFHKHCPRAAKPVMWALPLLTRALRAVLGRGFCFPGYIPTPLGRAFIFKLLLSASRIPGLGELLRLGFKALLDGDISQWDRALQMPHYCAQDMPAISVDQVLHLIQLVVSDSFRLYDYGSPAANVAHYGSPAPPDVAAEYWRLDLPVHLVAGRRDGIIPPPNIHRHLAAMKEQGVAVSYREFDFGHLDFTFGVKEELRMYLMRVLRM